MPSKRPTLYNLNKTHFWFAVSSVILLIGLVWMVIQDSTREWKGWQRKYMAFIKEKTEKELEAAKQAVDQDKLAGLKEQLTAAQTLITEHKADIAKLSKELDGVNLKVTKAKSRYQDLKQFQDSDKYFFEEAALHHDKEKADEYQKRINERKPEIDSAKLEFEKVDAEREVKEAEIDQWTGKKTQVEKEITKINWDIANLEKKIANNEPTIATEILNAPMLDFINPTLRIQQIVVEDLHEDYFYAKAEKVDRCITCHLGIDQKGLEDAPAPFTTHPNLDLFLAPDSPHPMEKFGCTTCHGGGGHSVSFTTAAHTPRDDEQAKVWKKKYNWHKMKHWTDKMLPLQYTEASCAKCHTGTVEVPEAPKLNQGRKLAETFGCYGCHKVQGFERWEVGPSLDHVQSKLEADWIVRWLQNPKEFRPSTKMPKIFHLSNTSDQDSTDKNNAAIAGITAYLMKNSDPIILKKAPKGEAEKGQLLVEEIGCLGCHTVGDKNANNHGPELTGMGSKVTADWLFTWLKDPKHYYPDSRMPDMRLTDQEAADITAYLLQDRNEKFESMRAPYVKPEAVTDLAMSFMTGRKRYEDAKAELDAMSAEEQLEYVGAKMINHQGCFACHDIKGFEDAGRIGTELTYQGSKDVSKLDFGHVHDIGHTKHDWTFNKLKNPRIYDRGKVRPYLEKLKMPEFGFTDEQAEALTTFVLSLQKVDIPLEMQKNLTETDQTIEEGRLLVSKFNCTGCHTLDGKEGGVRSILEDMGNAPPILDGEGAKVREAWLYHFLHDPTIIRPWLKYRMPSFGLTHEELVAFVEYFNGLSDVHASFIHDQIPETTPEYLKVGKELYDMFQCEKCHKSNPEPGLSAAFLAPNLEMSKERLRPQWIIDWILDPQAVEEGTMMPGFFPDGETYMADILDGDAMKQITAIRDYLMVKGHEKPKKSAPPAAPKASEKAPA